ncbi:MAG: oligosaccharide flippase family protein [Candidatus Methanoperedens sp.]|nr:oligosaccharide flippase family protein [Candidatus Methanoperedens sp.]
MKNNDKNAEKTIQNLLKNIGQDAFIYFPSKILPVLLGFISIPIYTRLFSTSEYGDYSLVMATVNLISVLGIVWLSSSTLRFYDSYKKDKNLNTFYSTLLFSLLISLILISILGLLVLFLLRNILPEQTFRLMYLGIIFFIIYNVFDVHMTILRADQKSGFYTLIQIISIGGNMILGIGLALYLELGIASILWSAIILNLIMSLSIMLKQGFTGLIGVKFISKNTLRDFSSYGFPLIFVSTFSWILNLSDRYIIGFMRDNAEVGIYSVNYQLAGYPISMFYQILMFSAFPIIINAWENHSPENTQKLITQLTRYYFIFTLPALVGLSVLSLNIITIIVNKSFVEGYVIVPWIALSTFILGLCQYINKGAELLKKTKLLIILTSLTAVSNVVLDLILVPKFGYLGAAIGSTISYLLYFVISIFVSKYHLVWIPPIKSFINCFLSSVVMGCGLLLLRNYFAISTFSLFILIIIGIFIYLIGLVLSGEIISEIKYINRRLQ